VVAVADPVPHGVSSWGFAPLLVVFAAAGAMVWAAGVKLSDTTDVLASRLGLGEALGGVVLLAIATNLPEIAITASAALGHHVDIAVGNILGGIAIQTVVLAVLDACTDQDDHPLTYQAASLLLVLEGALVLSVLALAVMATQLPRTLVAARLAPGAVAIAVTWGVGVLLISRAQKGLPWQAAGEAPGGQEEPHGHSVKKREAAASEQGVSTRQAAAVFAAAAVATLVGGVLLERSGSGMAGHLHMEGVIFGATILAAATSLPEVSTGLTSVRMGDHKLAVSDIFGGNAFLPVLFLLAVVLSGQAVLPDAQDTDIYLTGLGALLTTVYIWGLITRPKRRILRMGPDSFAVVLLYALGIAGLVAIAVH
jgi:cation:H+ antiporter